MVKNIEVTSENNESNANLIRRFSRRVRNSNVLYRARKTQQFRREKSENMKRQAALEQKRRLKEIDRLIKLGKLPDRRGKNYTPSTLDDED